MEKEMKLKPLDMIQMGCRIRSRREFLGMTRENLADCLGVSSKFISDVEYGAKGLSIKNLHLLVQILDVSADYILADKECPEEEKDDREKLLKEITEPLKSCTTEQLRCTEQIIRLYVEALKNK